MFKGLFDEPAFKILISLGSAASGLVSVATGDWSVAVFGVPFPVLVAGFAGALIAVAMMPPLARWYLPLGIGTGISAYTTSFGALLLDKLTPLGDTDDRVVAFIFGLVSYYFLALFFQDGRDIILGFIRARFGAKIGGGQ